MNRRITIAAAFAVALTSSFCSTGPKVTKTQSEVVAPFDGRKFDNIEPFADKNLLDVLRWRWLSNPNRKTWPEKVEQTFFSPVAERSQTLKVAVLGHATVLIQVDGLNVLTDPQFSQRASPVSWAGPKRVRQPGIPFDELPPIDAVLISHDHYDALDIPTLKRLQKKWSPKIFVGLGNKALLTSEGISNVHEMDWWESIPLAKIEIYFVPVQHWSARGIADKRETLWGGFVVRSAQGQIFFAGDTGYGTGKVFRMIHEKLGPMKLSLIPIGAFEPREFMKNAHVWPTESVKIFKDTKTQHAVGIHFGTFAGLTDEGIDDPEQALRKALKQENISENLFIVPEFGRTYSY